MGRKKRKKQGRKRGWKAVRGFVSSVFSLAFRVLPLVLLISLAVGLVFGVKTALYADSNLNISEIVIQPPDSLSHAVRQDLESRLVGKNMLKTDIRHLAAELEKDPKIRTAKVFRQFPAQLKIDVEQRVPIAAIRFSSRGQYGLIADDGMVLDVSDERNHAFTLIEAFHIDRRNPKIGYQLKDRGYRASVRFLKAFWRHPVSAQQTVSTIQLDRLGNVNVTLGDSPLIRLGRKPAERLAAIEKVQPILKAADRRNIEYLDLQYEDVIVKRKN